MRKASAVLVSALATALVLSGFVSYMLLSKGSQESSPNENWTKTFSFWWSPDEQNITSGNGLLWMNFTFSTVGENLSIIVEVNDDEGYCGLTMAFDRNNNGKIDYGETDFDFPEIHGVRDTPYDFDSDNMTMTPWITVEPNGLRRFASVGEYPSPWHTCTFSNETGFTFKINLPLKEVGSTGLVYAIFSDPDNPLITDPVTHETTYKFSPPESTLVYLCFSYLP